MPPATDHLPQPVETRIVTPNCLPTFVGIGAQRAGSTWVHQCLNEHPQIFMPRQKELGFFGRRDSAELPRYAEHFAHGAGHDVRGEVTPTYLYDPRALEQIASDLPGVRLFAVLREPVSRAFSAYQLFGEQRYRGVSFAQACTADSDLVRYGRYAEALDVVWRHFDRGQVKVFLYDDLASDPQTLLRGLYRFIGVDPDFQPTCRSRRYNRIMFPRTQRRLEQFGLGGAVNWFKTTRAGDWVRTLHARAGRRAADTLSPRQRKRIAAQFADDIDRLEVMLGRSLDAWRLA